MLRKAGRIGIILCALIIMVSMFVFTGCGGPSLKGKQFVIGNWWTNWHVDTFEPRNEAETTDLEWRRKIQADNGFTMWEEEICGWDDYLQTITNIILAGDKKYSTYYVGADWAMSFYKQGLLAPIPSNRVKVTGQSPIAGVQPGYMANIADLFTFNGNQYAMGIGDPNNSWQSILMLFNKRLLREAGIDPELPYDLQKAGTWTWDAFMDMLRKTTRDTSNRGINDVFGTHADGDGDVFSAIVYSNGANHITFDNSGNAINATTTPAYLEAAQFFNQLREEGVMMQEPDGAGWAWQFFSFVDGKIAFFIGQEWFKGMAGDMQDDFGSVVLPKGPRAQNYRVSHTDNVLIIPAIFSPEEVAAIVQAVDLWYVPSEDDWKAGHYWAYRDRRAVDETMAIAKTASNLTYRNYMLVPGMNDAYRSFVGDLNFTPGNPAPLIEQYAPRYNSLVNTFNGR